jgi:peptidoglycan-associated lipoprotein
VYDNSDNKRKTKIEGVKVVVTAKTGEKWEGVTAKNGSVFWDKKPNGDRFINENASYKIMISKPKHLEDKKGAELTTEGLTYDQNFIIDMGLYPDRPIKLPEVRYPTAQWSFVVDSTINSLDSLAVVYSMFEQNPGLVIELSSHTDSRGPDVSNQVLSENRAKACYKYLVEEKGVDPRRIVPVGKGEREPRRMFLKDGKYYEKPTEGSTEVILTEAYINTFKADVVKYNMLLQFNRRTEARILSLEFEPATAPASNPEYLKFKVVPKK